MTGYEHVENEKEMNTYHQQDPQAKNERVMRYIKTEKHPEFYCDVGFH